MLNLTKNKQPSVGIALHRGRIDVACVEDGNLTNQRQYPSGSPLFNESGSQLEDENALLSLLQTALAELPFKPTSIHVTLPTTLMRQVDLPKMAKHELFFSLSSEAERFKLFDGTDALVTYDINDQATGVPAQQQRLLFAALRSDTLQQVLGLFKVCKVKVASIQFEDFQLLRALEATGVLASLHQQLPEGALWGACIASYDRLRYFIWRKAELVVTREVQLEAYALANPQGADMMLDDVQEDLLRTVQMANGQAPAIWLCHGFSDTLLQLLNAKNQLPFQPMVMVLAQQGGMQPASAAVGAAYSALTSFPLVLNLAKARSQAKQTDVINLPSSAKGADPSSVIDDGVGWDPKAKTLLGLAAASVLVIAATWLGGGLFTTQLVNQQQAAQQELAAVNGRIALLTEGYNEVKANYELKASLLAVADQAQLRNQVSKRVGLDLKKLTTPHVWLSGITLDNKLSMEGTSLNHKEVLSFAKHLDNVGYANSVMVDDMSEDFVGNTPIYTFKVSSNVYLNPQFLPTPSSLLSQSAPSSL